MSQAWSFSRIGAIFSIKADSGIPVVRSVRIHFGFNSFSCIIGITESVIIAFISAGTPGSEIKIVSFTCNLDPRAEPTGFGTTTPSTGTRAWFRLDSGIWIPERLNRIDSDSQ